MKSLIALLALLSILSGCATGGDTLKPLIGPEPRSAQGMNVGIGDLINRGPDYGVRLGTYLDEIAAAGNKREVRMVVNKSWGPQFVQYGAQELRKRGFKLLAIVSEGNQQSGPPNLEADIAWARLAIPQIRDLLVAIELCNEPWQTIPVWQIVPFPPAEYVAWNNALYVEIKRLAPEVPIWLQAVDRDWWYQVAALHPNHDTISLHLYGKGDPIPTNVYPPYHISETERTDLQAQDVYLYVWQGVGEDAKWAIRPGGGILP